MTLATLALGSLAAYALARYEFRGAKVLALAILSARLIPGATMVLPYYVLFRLPGLTNSTAGLIPAYVGFSLPFACWLMYGFFLEVPSDIEDSARIDGCTDFSVFWRIVLPLTRPGLAATAILVFPGTWNEFLYALVLAGRDSRTLPVFLSTFINERLVFWGGLFAVASVMVTTSTVPTLADIRIGRIVDLSHELTPWKEPSPLEVTHRRERVTQYTKMQDVIFIGSHTGTHMESELHYRYGGWDVSQINLADCIGPAIVLDFSHKALKEPISLQEMQAAGDIQVGDRVLIHIGGDKLYRTEHTYHGAWPTAEACRWLVEDRHIRLFGTGGNAFNVMGDKTGVNHATFLSDARIPVIENLAHLGDLRKQRIWLVAVPMRIRGLDASPIRALAIEEAD